MELGDARDNAQLVKQRADLSRRRRLGVIPIDGPSCDNRVGEVLEQFALVQPVLPARVGAVTGNSRIASHLVSQSLERADDRHACRIGRWFPQHPGQLLGRVVHLDGRDDGFAIRVSKARERSLVSIERLSADGLLERRRRRRGAVWKRPAFGLALHAADLIAQTVQHRLAEIGADRTFAARFEAVQPLKRSNEGVLYKVVRVAEIARPPGQAPTGPPFEPRQISREKVVQRGGVAGAGAFEQRK